MRAGVLAVLACLLAAAGCATSRQHFAALSSQQVPLLGADLDHAPRVPDVWARVRTQQLLWIPTNTSSPTLQEAVDAALRRGNGNLLVDADVEHWWVWVPFLYGQEGWQVHGDVLRVEPPP